MTVVDPVAADTRSLAGLVAEPTDGAAWRAGSRAVGAMSLRRLDRGVVAVSALPALVALAVCLYQLSWRNVLFGVHEYDDGVYLGAALRLVAGVIPYRDFVIVHPPGIVLLMTPLALVGRIFGTNVALAGAREVTAVVTALNVMLAGLAVRHRGRKAAFIAATALACFPMAPAADSTLFLEPYLIFFSLLGLIAMYSDGRLAPPRRLVVAGIFFGLGGAVKVWAVFVIAAALLACGRRIRTGTVPLAGGVTLGVGVPCLPFFVMAPGRFLHDVIGAQLPRVGSGNHVFSFGERVLWLTGMAGIRLFKAPDTAAEAVALVFVALVVAVFVRGRGWTVPADRMVLLAALGGVLAMCAANDLYAHYVYFSAAFLSLLLGVAGSRAVDMGAPRLRIDGRRALGATAGVCVLAGGFLVPQQVGYARAHLSAAKDPTALNLVLPSNSCIVSDEAVVEISADLFVSQRKGCPALVDAYGTWLADGPAYRPAYGDRALVGGVYKLSFPPRLVREWEHWLNQADYVVELAPQAGYIPWTPALRAWFFANFKSVTSPVAGQWLYRHVGHELPPPVR